MKKPALIILSLLLFSNYTQAQLQRHDISITTGIYSSNFFDAVDYDIFTGQNLIESVSKNIGEQTGAIYFTYRFFPIPDLTIGLTGGFERVKGEILVNSSPTGNYYNDYVSAAFELDYRYVNKRNFQLYSGIGVGILFNEETNQLPTNYEFNEEFRFAYQVNAIGMRYGRVFGVFIEVGYGYKGLLKAGINVQL